MTNELIEKMAEAMIRAWAAQTFSNPTDVALASAKAAYACIPEVTKEQLVNIIAAGVYRVVSEDYGHPWIFKDGNTLVRDTSTPEVLISTTKALIGEQTATAAVKAMLAAYPNGFRVKD